MTRERDLFPFIAMAGSSPVCWADSLDDCLFEAESLYEPEGGHVVVWHEADGKALALAVLTPQGTRWLSGSRASA